MNDNVPIKIKNSAQPSQQDIKKALNLNQMLAEANKPPKKHKFWPILTLVLFLIILTAGAWLFWLRSTSFSPLQKFTPQQSKAAIFLKLSDLKDDPCILPDFGLDSSLYQWIKNQVYQFLTVKGLSAENDLLPLFQNYAAFFVMPPENQKPTWVALLETVPEAKDKNPETFAKIEDGLRQAFGLTQLFYRQIKINVVKPLNYSNSNHLYYYAQINNFLAISNNLSAIQGLIDQLVNKSKILEF